MLGADWSGLLSIALNKVSAVIYSLWQAWTARYIFHTFTHEATWKIEKKKKKKHIANASCICPSTLQVLTHIFTNEVLLVLHDAPRSDADGADLAP